MAMDKAIESGKEHRKKYYGAKAICRSCRNGGSCPYCQSNRKYKYLKKLQKSVDKEVEEWYNEENKEREE